VCVPRSLLLWLATGFTGIDAAHSSAHTVMNNPKQNCRHIMCAVHRRLQSIDLQFYRISGYLRNFS